VEASDPAGVEHGARARIAQRRILGDRAFDEPDRLAHTMFPRMSQRLGDEVRVLDRPRGE
jgi:hypothetical protein